MNIPIHDFKYDKFQEQAIEIINKDKSLIVSAPTGAGKTVIADYVTYKSINQNKGVIYTAPIKALSNQKYRDFIEIYGRDKVGIVTGDVVINSDALILIMTTEIFRNRLFDDKHSIIDGRKWVIFDEIHYLDDLERGTVWEESLIFFPKELNLLALSATIPNIYELANWIQSIHKRSIEVIIENKRPVPLSFHFMCKNIFYTNFSKSFKNEFKGKNKNTITNRVDVLITHLQNKKIFPAIYFIFSRKRCEVLAKECRKFKLVTSEEKKKILSKYDKLLTLFNLTDDPHALELRPFIQTGIAFHHAGILPPLKEIIERLFTSKLIKLIFTTETFALGINMPAKAVIFDALRKYYGNKFDFLKTRDFFQMAGRAGRRNFDSYGDVYSIINPRRISYNVLKTIIQSEPEPVYSQFNSSYATILNLYDILKENIFSIYPLSFHYFQSGSKSKKRGLKVLQNKIQFLKFLGYIDNSGLTSRGRFASKIFGYELQTTELFMKGFFEERSEIQICVMILAMIFEPRKNQGLPPLSKTLRRLNNIAMNNTESIYKVERLFNIKNNAKRFYFHLSEALAAWMDGASFEELHNYTDVDEGEIIRNFRITLQILRELRDIKNLSMNYYNKIKNCIKLIKRDIIDPEKQFEIDL